MRKNKKSFKESTKKTSTINRKTKGKRENL